MLNLKKKVLTLALSVFCAGQMMAVPAYPGKMLFKQADGTVITVQRLGDEHYHMLVTEDGYPLAFNAATNNYEYAELTADGLKSSRIVATEMAQRDSRAMAYLQTLDKGAMMELANQQFAAAVKTARARMAGPAKAAKASQKMRMTDVPTVGKLKVLNILVEFSNKKFSMSDPKAYYDKFFHEKGFSENGASGSVHDFYYYGSNELYDPDIDCYGPITVSGTYQSYAGSDGTENAYKMVQEACRLLGQQGVDLSPYDTNGDGKVDNVYVIYAGYGQADSNHSNTIWPHSWTMSQSGEAIKVGSVTVDRYATSQELNGQTNRPVGIGTFVHEFGHVLGLADHYNTLNSSATNQPGDWDLMASGSYNDNQNTPCTFSAFERYSLDWMEYTELTNNADSLVTLPNYAESGKAYRVSVPSRDNEYFVIENRQNKGWDSHLPGHGLLVWHIEEDKSYWDINNPNGDPTHQRVDVVEADRRASAYGDSGDSFPGSNGVTSFTFNGWYDKAVFGFAYLDEIVGGDAHFLLTGTELKLESPQVSVTDVKGRSAKISWTESKYASSYTVSIAVGDKVVFTENTTEREMEITGLEAETEYTAIVVANLSGYTSDPTKANFTTTGLELEESKVNVTAASEITGSSFRANWERLAKATSYDVTLYSRTQDGRAEKVCGFDEGVDNLPEGWETNSNTTSSSYYGEAAPSLRLNNEGMYLQAAIPGNKILNLKFWYRASKSGNTLTVSEFVDGKWQQVGETINPVGAQKVVADLSINSADSVRITFGCPLGSGYLLIDDVSITYPYEVHTPIKTVSVDGDQTSCVFTDLDASVLYSYTVVGRDGDRKSLVSNAVSVPQLDPTGIHEVDTKAETLTNAAVFDLQGRRVGVEQQLSSLPKGIYIVRGKKIVVK